MVDAIKARNYPVVQGGVIGGSPDIQPGEPGS